MEQWGLSKRSRVGFFAKRYWFYEKILKFPKIADGNKFAVQCERISKVSQNVQLLEFGNIKEDFGFSGKPEVFLNGKGSKLAVESTDIVTVLKKFKLQAF